jgi:hypothetical protein
LSFRDLTVRGRRAGLLAALGASTGLAAMLLVGERPASASVRPDRGRPSVHLATRESPPIAHTGGFGEPTCEACHWGEPLNEPSGSLAVDGFPPRFQPGSRYVLTVSLRRPGLVVGGFELAVRYDGGASNARQAGSLRALDDRVAVSRNDTTGVHYAHHTLPGTIPMEPGVGRWRIEWTAPIAPAGGVVMHVAANAGDQNDSPFGDFIYTKAVAIPTGEK